MRSSKRIERLVVDANPILSALIGGRAREAFLSPVIGEFATTRHTLGEVRRYIPVLAGKPKVREAGVTEGELYAALAVMPLSVYPRTSYRGKLEEARRRIGHRDPDDVDLLALALALEAPIWSNDADFEVAGVERFTTAELLALLKDADEELLA